MGDCSLLVVFLVDDHASEPSQAFKEKGRLYELLVLGLLPLETRFFLTVPSIMIVAIRILLFTYRCPLAHLPMSQYTCVCLFLDFDLCLYLSLRISVLHLSFHIVRQSALYTNK